MPIKLTVFATALPFLALGFAACAPSVDVDASNEAAVTSQDAVCSFPKRTYERPIADHYVAWPTDAKREAFLSEYLPMMGLRRSTKAGELPALQAMVDALYPSIVAELPAETQGMAEPPHVVLIDDALPNAFAANDPRESPPRAPWLLFVNEGLLTLNAPAEEVRGVMAHEIAHLVAKHQFPDAPARVRRHYSTGARDEKSVVPSLEKDDEQVRAFADKFESLVAFGGAFDVPALKGFPVRFSGLIKPIRYHVFFEMMGRVPTTECGEYGQKYGAMQESLRKHLSKFDHQLRIEGAAVPETERVATEAERAATACATSASITLTDLAVEHELAMNPGRRSELEAASAKGPEALRAAVLDADEIAVDDGGGGDVVSKLLALGKMKRQLLAKHVQSAAGGADKLRRYAEEVEADQIAVRVLRHAGIAPAAGAGFLLRSLDSGARAQCDATLGRGEVPPFGGFSFLHPATCWRVFQARLFAEKLSTCGAITKAEP
jgi:hypothetical protein